LQLKNREIRIETTNRCNGNCIFCPREEMTRPKVTMPFKHFISLIEQAYLLGIDTVSPFGFGEPLLDKKISSNVATCYQMGFDTFITTNATLLTVEKSHDLVKAGLSHIRFSVHGMGANYERVQRGFNWNTTMTNVHNFLKINHVKYDHKCKVSISVIPMHNEDLESIIMFWDRPEIDYLEVWRPHGWGGVRKYREETPIKLKTCGRPHSGPIQIQADGKVIPCCFLTNGEVILGDTHRNTIEEIVKGKKYNAFRISHETGNLKGLPCENCDQLYIGDNPLLYSSRDKDRNINVTSSTKFNLKEN
jgi:radical SAM protein with 4Fe4S-binding SPASM domain